MSEYDRLVQIGVRYSCKESWKDMTPDSEGRFCSHCSKSVLDLSLYSKEETKALFQDKESLPCVRYMKDKHGNILHRENLQKAALHMTLMSFFVFISSCIGLFMYLSSTPAIQSAVAENSLNYMSSSLHVSYTDSEPFLYGNEDSLWYDIETIIIGTLGASLLILSLLLCTLSSLTWIVSRKRKWLFSSIGLFCVTLFIFALRVILISQYPDNFLTGV